MNGDGTITSPNDVNVLEVKYAQTSGGGGCNNVAQFYMIGSSCTIDNIVNVRQGAGTVTNGILVDGTMTTGISIAATLTNALSISGTLAAATGRGIKSAVTINNGAITDGYGANEFDLTLTGTTADHCAALSSWVNMATGTHGTGGLTITPMSVGIWEDSAAVITGGCLIFGMRMQAIIGDTDPKRLCMFSVNVSGDTLHSIFDCTGVPSVTMGYTADDSASAAMLGQVPLFTDSNDKVYYVRVYESE